MAEVDLPVQAPEAVNIMNPDGELVSIPAHQVQVALSKGYSMPDPDYVKQQFADKTHGSLGSQIATGLEHAASTATFGLSTGLETGLGISDPEDIRARSEANPTAATIGSLAGLAIPIPGTSEFEAAKAAGKGAEELVGAGTAAEKALTSGKMTAEEAAPAMQAAKEAIPTAQAGREAINPFSAQSIMSGTAERAANALGLAPEGAGFVKQLSGSAFKGALETGMFQAGDEVSKAFADDPDSTFGNAIEHIGMASLLGGGVGGVFGVANPLWKATAGDKLSQFVEDAKSRLKEYRDVPDPASKLNEELKTFHSQIKEMGHEVYGAEGLKAQDIEKALPEKLNDKIVNQVTEFGNRLGGQLNEMRKNPLEYPPRLVNQVSKTVEMLGNTLENANQPKEFFNALQRVKQEFQGLVEDSGLYDKVAPLRSISPEYSFVKKIDAFAKEAKSALEDSSVWKRAAESQKNINTAFSTFLPKLKDFESKFTTKVEGERVIDPGKLQTYINQTGKAGQKIKQEMLGNYLDAAEKYRDVVKGIHDRLGIENPYGPTSLSYTKSTLGEQTKGAQFVDAFMKKAAGKLAGITAGGGIGSAVGASIGHPYLGFLIGEHVLGPVFTSVLPSIMKPLMTNASSGEGFKAAAEYGLAAQKGDSLLTKATKNVFKAGEEVIPAKLIPDDKERQKLEKKIEGARLDPSKLLNTGGALGAYAPQHGTTVAQSVMNTVNTLNAMKPRPVKTAPLDSEPKVSSIEKAKYDRALDIAERPSLVLKDVKEGTVTPSDIALLKQLSPGSYKVMSQKLMNAMTDHISDGGEIPYKTRMGVSLFLDQPLDSTLTPQSIASSQMTFNTGPKPSQMGPETRQHKPSENSLKKISSMDQTQNQRLESRHI